MAVWWHKTVVRYTLAIVALLGMADGGADTLIAANGRLEGRAPAAHLAFSRTGRIEKVTVVEGMKVQAGEVLAELDCSALTARLSAANARLAIARRGDRAELVAQHRANVAIEDAETRRYQAQVRRLTTLASKDLAAKSMLEDAALLVDTSQARKVLAQRVLEQSQKPQPKEELRVAGAEVESLTSELRECALRAPDSGVVLRRLLEPGTVVSELMPQTVIEFANTAEWNVRAEVDEADVGDVRVGQSALVSAPAFRGKDVRGRVVRVSEVMGRRTILSGDPGEKMDRDVLEVLIRLDSRPVVATVGLRVKVRFLP